MTRDYRDHPDKYLRYRPQYPASLFSWIVEQSPDRELAWDCACGSGQAAIGLSEYFSKVIASDLNQSQLEHALPASNVSYLSSRAEVSPLKTNSVSVAVVACAVHWFDRDRFYQECRRVLKAGGLLVVWTYEWPWLEDEGLDSILLQYRDQVLGSLWPEASQLYFERYRTLDFPFEELETPNISIELNWGPEELLGFLGTWSAPQRYLRETGKDSTELIGDSLRSRWREIRRANVLQLPLYLRAGRYACA